MLSIIVAAALAAPTPAPTARPTTPAARHADHSGHEAMQHTAAGHDMPCCKDKKADCCKDGQGDCCKGQHAKAGEAAADSGHQHQH